MMDMAIAIKDILWHFLKQLNILKGLINMPI